MGYPVFASGDVLNASDMNAVGLWRTGSINFTGQTTAQLNNCFTSDFDKYQIVYNLRTAGANTGIQFRLSVGGTPNATAGSYVNGGRYVGFPAVPAADFNGANAQMEITFTGTIPSSASFTLVDPRVTRPTSITGTAMSVNAALFFGGYHNQSTAYDGLFILNSAAVGLFGTLNVYGWKN